MKKLYGLGLMLTIVGLAGFMVVCDIATKYERSVTTDYIFVICLILTLLLAIGGFVIVFAFFDR